MHKNQYGAKIKIDGFQANFKVYRVLYRRNRLSENRRFVFMVKGCSVPGELFGNAFSGNDIEISISRQNSRRVTYCEKTHRLTDEKYILCIAKAGGKTVVEVEYGIMTRAAEK